MSKRKQAHSFDRAADTLRTVDLALRDLSRGVERVRFDQLVAATGLEPADVEEAMSHYERTTPVRARRVVVDGDLAWAVR